MPIERPLLKVSLGVSRCSFQIQINGAIVAHGDEGFTENYSVPINHWLRSGENSLEVLISPIREEINLRKNLKCHINIEIMPIQEDDKTVYDICSIVFALDPSTGLGNITESSPAGRKDSQNNYRDDSHGDIIIGETGFNLIDDHGAVAIKRYFTISLPFPIWHWMESDFVENSDDTKNSLLELYGKIWASIQNRTIYSLISLFAERNEELTKAYYLNDDINQEIAGYLQAANNPELEMVEIDRETTILDITGNGRLANLTRWDGDPLVAFNYKDGTGSLVFEILYRKSGDKWVICR